MTTSRWVVPCNFVVDNRSAHPIIYDLTGHLKKMLLNEVWNRKFSYGFNEGLKKTNPDDIKGASIKVFPRFVSGEVNQSRIPELVHQHYGKLPAYVLTP